MAEIHILSSETINQIAAGEVVERPVNVVKELVENAIDAGSTAITVEIQNGGIDLIRVTDNGCGIEPSQITKAFRRHATSKISSVTDLDTLSSLGFRGEALSSIAAVSMVEMITKTKESIVGTRAVNRSQTDSLSEAAAPSEETALDLFEVGAPDGTSVIVRNLFYNVPVRRKFLKSASTEAGYITDLVQNLALSHPDISFHYRVNRQEKLHTTGNSNEKELIYRIYGRDMASSVIPIDVTEGELRVHGFLGRPEFSRSSRSYETFFVNGRILRSNLLSKALEAGYRTDLMQHRFPFAILHLTIPSENMDVNVHPTKMEVRFSDSDRIYRFVDNAVQNTLHPVELIPRATFSTQAQEKAKERERVKAEQMRLNLTPHVEQFEKKPESFVPFIHEIKKAADSIPIPPKELSTENTVGKTEEAVAKTNTSALEKSANSTFLFEDTRPSSAKQPIAPIIPETEATSQHETPMESVPATEAETPLRSTPVSEPSEFDTKNPMSSVQDYAETLYGSDIHEHLFDRAHRSEYAIIGQVFKTYWMIQYGEKLLMIDQHAAHEKVNFERLMKRLQTPKSEVASQMIAPPIIINLTGKEEGAYLRYADVFLKMGYEIEPFGDGSYAIRSIPMELYANEPAALFREVLDEILSEKLSGTPDAILYKIASMSCKAAVKGNQKLSVQEAHALIDELLSLDNPYHCPHGRPTMIVLSQKDLEKKFKRIV